MSRARIEDVALAAGVSVATVSRALRDLPNVALSTRSKVLKVALELDYVADPNASRLAAGATRTVAMALPSLNSWYFSQVVSGVHAVLTESSYDLLLYGVSSDEQLWNFLRGPMRRRTDAMILVELRLAEDEAEALLHAGVTLATVGVATSTFPSVNIDNVAVSRKAIDHLVGLGHKRIGVITGQNDGPLNFRVPSHRLDGFHLAMEQHELRVDPQLLIGGNFSIQGGYEAMLQIIGSDDPPTAVFAMSDEMAMGALMAMAERGIRVPQDVSIIGVDDHDAATVLGLTTIRQPVVEHGAIAARLILDQLSGDAGSISVRHEAETSLVVRRTTAVRSESSR